MGLVMAIPFVDNFHGCVVLDVTDSGEDIAR
jgi:hypothetical protein